MFFSRNTSPPPSPSSITPPSSPSSPSPSPSPSPSLSPVPSPTPDPPLLYNVLLSVLLGVLALMTSRFRCLWVPAMCCVAAAILCSVGLWRKVLEKIRLPRKLVRMYCDHNIIYNLFLLLRVSILKLIINHASLFFFQYCPKPFKCCMASNCKLAWL